MLPCLLKFIQSPRDIESKKAEARVWWTSPGQVNVQLVDGAARMKTPARGVLTSVRG